VSVSADHQPVLVINTAKIENPMFIRKYIAGEEVELWNLFFHTVRNINIQDYTLEQVEVWAAAEMDPQRWRSKIAEIAPYVCVCDEVIVGYADLQESGYIDHFYVHHQWQGQGVGKRLFGKIESEANLRGITELTSNVSITARPFFESRGFHVVATQQVPLGTQLLTNFRMSKLLEWKNRVTV
jgi:putative acetyltransferase